MESAEKTNLETISWERWAGLLVLSALLIPVGVLCAALVMIPFVLTDLGDSDSAVFGFNLITSLTVGGIVGLGQYWLLQTNFKTSSGPEFVQWVALSCGSTALGMIFLELFLQNWIIGGVVTGLLLGFGQWALLRKTIQRASWWIVMTVVVWSVEAWLLNWYSCNQYVHLCWP
jgi:hypothetical protein